MLYLLVTMHLFKPTRNPSGPLMIVQTWSWSPSVGVCGLRGRRCSGQRGVSLLLYPLGAESGALA